jgi:glycerol-3-phosphate acyltransferase PlsY
MRIVRVGRGTVTMVSPLSRLASAAAIGYFLGTFPTADLVARRASRGRIDLRQAGSGNPGSANALNVLGKKAGAQVLAGDIGKGAAACAIGGLVAGPIGAHLAGTSSVVGHCYPVWNGFRGGKGVATSVGQCLATLPVYVPIDLAIATAVAAGPWKHRAFPATMAASATWVAASVVWWRRQIPNAWGGAPTAGHVLAAAASSALITTRFLAGRSA